MALGGDGSTKEKAVDPSRFGNVICVDDEVISVLSIPGPTPFLVAGG